MASLLASTKNTRPLRKGSLRYIRSDAVARLCEKEMAWLAGHHILTIVDLRTPAEVEANPCCLKGRPGFCYYNTPVTGGNAVPQTPEAVPASYLNMVDGAMREIISLIEGAETNVLFFCSAGKDRTGVVAALLLLRQGAAHGEIVADYMQSCDNLRELLDEYIRCNPGADLGVITPRAEYMERFLCEVAARHAGFCAMV